MLDPRVCLLRSGRVVGKREVDIPPGRVAVQRNIRGHPFGVGFDFCRLPITSAWSIISGQFYESHP